MDPSDAVSTAALNRQLEQIEALPHWRRVAFLLSCCSRMIPNIEKYAGEGGQGDFEAPALALARAWDWLDNGKEIEAIDRLIERCEATATTASGVPSRYAGAAMDASNAVAATLSHIRSSDQAALAEVTTLARDSIDLFIQDTLDLPPSGVAMEAEIESHPLMQAEVRAQMEALAAICQDHGDRATTSRRFRSRWEKPEAGSLP